MTFTRHQGRPLRRRPGPSVDLVRGGQSALRIHLGWGGLGLAVLLALIGLGCGRTEGATVGRSTATPASSETASVPAAVRTAATPASAMATVSASASAPAPVDPLGTDEWPPAVVDLHVDTPFRVHLKDPPLRLPHGHVTADKVKKGGYAGIVWVIYIPDYLHKKHPRVSDADEILGIIDKMVDRHAVFEFSPAADGHRSLVEGKPREKVTVFLAIEGAGAFADDPAQIDRFIERGVRLVGLVHAHDDALAGSATGSKAGGLTEAGKEFARRIYERGALVDVSHMSDPAFADLVPIADAARAPIVATHSNARALRDHKRNLSDEQLRIIGRTGGVAGLNLHRSYVRRKSAKLEHIADHAMHMIEVAGIDHVALGSDFDGGRPVRGLEDAAHWPALAEELKRRGLSEDDIRKVFSRNALRVLRWRPPR